LLQRAGEGVSLSRHAQQRVDRRELNLDAARLQRLDSAISRAAEKGSRNSVVMLDDLAVVVDVRARTVVTAIEAQQGKEKVFTNIDSVVIA
jgi:flagellar operon protein